ncbi:hypothetical protein BABINDRAFT_159773 [Babjeviella inositovora NRRL Y-12698]|uniref:Uncharacterized protein n=1 Tax=Babjeviella inositovora NRRL Y-12698 TaxID=984486 RepID=A0A1E3QUY6_9ASCO|nr:uncharacterized protein BABINDRAFT_159773 [Babjeviella inositovora NRRL Y-12698]ODQ81493.1 hypothetical protein BABINDRAFT_159773 [Babjeviella inositovora NRRL Y-12698]
MSTVWVRGPACGVDNCRSRLWRSSDGHKICQYGHVRDGAVEYNDDDDEFVQTRRLNIHNAKHAARLTQISQLNALKEAKKKKFFGMRGKELFLRCFQIVLKRQVQWLVREKALPQALEPTVKQIWCEYLGSFMVSQPGTETDETESLSTEEPEADLKSLPKFLHTLVICYLACVRLKVPVYLNDFIMWASSNKIPYMKIIDDGTIIPRSLMQNLPQYYMKLFSPAKPPLKGELYFHTHKILACLKDKSAHPIQPLLFKLVYTLVLPPQIYLMTETYLQKSVCVESEYKLAHSPELKVASALITCTKLYFLNLNEGSRGRKVSFHTWERVYSALMRSINNNLSNNDLYFDTLLNTLLVKNNRCNHDILEMSDRNTEQYLEWFTNNIIDTDETRPEKEMREISIVQKRLLDIFKLTPLSEAKARGNTDKPEAQDIADIYTAYNTMFAEIKAVLPGAAKRPRLAMTIETTKKLEELLVDILSIRMGVTRPQLQACVKWSDGFLQ